MSIDKYLTYRGDIRAAVGSGGTILFVTRHAEGQPTGLYRLDADTLSLDADPLPLGGLALAVEGAAVWIAGGDRFIHEGSVRGGKPKVRGTALATAPTSLALLADARIAVLSGSEVVILAGQDGTRLQSLELTEPGTCLAADPSGKWLAVGTSQGSVSIFDAEDRPDFLLGESSRLHEGAVTALLFEPDELRFLSAGADLKLLTTHARGKLEAEDKGRGNNHTDIITALTWGPGDRLYSGSRDGTIKSWPRAGNVRPSTIKDGVGRVVALALVEVHGRPRLVAACDDNSLRVFPIDAAGKIGDLSHRLYDAYARANSELEHDESRRREAALNELAGFGDTTAIELIAQQVWGDADHGLRLIAVQMLGNSGHPRAVSWQEKALGHDDEAVRVAAFHGLRTHLGASDLRPIDRALKAEKADVGRLAVEALETLATRDDQALARLLEALDAKTPEVRQAALASLERVHDPASPEADLVALGSKHSDTRRLALVRLFQRQLLRGPGVPSALRRSSEDADPEVRRAAFLLSLYTRDRLVQALRTRDPELQRQLAELEGTQPSGPEKAEKPKKTKAKADEPGLDDTDLEPLLQATASRALDTSLRGGRGLAVLGDPRAFGLLLQLSREDDKAARVEVCRAMGALDDPRAIERLRSILHDKEPEVRDAAFTALARLHQSDPLLAAASGLNASAEDVRRRGLQALIAEIRKAPPKGPEQPSWALLVRALNDSAETVRTEAFKAALNLQLAGGGARTLRFVLQSVHADVRREVLTEVMAQVAEPWGWDLLLEFFNDPDPGLRADAFAFAIKKTKGLEFLDAALGSRFPDLRKEAVTALVKKRTAAAQALLVRALEDPERAVRLSALESLIDAGALTALARAIENPNADVRLRAARALAKHGDPKALPPLLALAMAPEPTEPERQKEWAGLAESALGGLAELGDPAALPDVIAQLDSPHAALRKQAAHALTWVARGETLAALRAALRHADPEVKYRAALGLACAGDPSVASLVFAKEAAKILGLGDRIGAALALGVAGEDRLVVFLDNAKEEARGRALLLLLMREWKSPDGSASRLLAGLAARDPRMRLTAARGLESLTDPDGFAAFVVKHVNDRGDKAAWKIDADAIDALAELLVHGEPLLRARTARLLRYLDDDGQDAWDQAWAVHRSRFAAEIEALRRQAGGRTGAPTRSGAADLRELAFGAYVGLVREQGGTRGKGPKGTPDPQVVRVRQTALGRLLALAESDPHCARAARPVLVQSLGDPNQAVRLQAFEHLQRLGMEPTALAAEALASGSTDLGVKGLELLTAGAGATEGRAVLDQAMMSRSDDLAIEAAKLLIARLGASAVAGRALEAAYAPLRKLAVGWLADEDDRDAGARDRLRQALASRYQAVREAAALALAGRKDAAAFESLVKLLSEAHLPAPQRRFIEALETLGDPRAPGAFLDRLEVDPSGTAPADDLLRAAGRFRRPEDVDRLLDLMEKDRARRNAASAAVLAISGHDQPIEDRDDEQTDRRWEEKQFPRRDAMLARLMDRLAVLNDAKLLTTLIPMARWARGKEVEPSLAALVNHPDETLRRLAVEALGWRLRKRGAAPDALVKVLGHRDPITQFLAAEALAKAGRADGLNVLLASIDFVTDLALRRRAVLALGELGDARALDALLKLAAEDGHALQEQAAEAIGHLGRSEKADEIFAILQRHVKAGGSIVPNALMGLRWLDTRAGWQLIRRVAEEGSFHGGDATRLLGFNDDPATRDLLLKLLSGNTARNVGLAALASARRLWGEESLEPDYACLQNPNADYPTIRGSSEFQNCLGRVASRGEPARLLALLPHCAEGVRVPLATSLLNRATLPVAEARAALESPDARTVGVAARILGRSGDAKSGPALESALRKWSAAWEEQRRRARDAGDEEGALATTLTPCLRALVWASGRLGVARDVLVALAGARPDDPAFRAIRLEAVNALAASEMTPEVVAALEAAAIGGDPEVRALAAEAVGRRAPDRSEALAGHLLSDRISFRRLALAEGVRLGGVARSAARQVHAQGIVLPDLIEQGDVETLAAVAEDRTLPEVARLGAIEGLASTARDAADEILRRIGLKADEDEELRKAAWRGLRRSKRARRKAVAANAGGTP